MPAVAALTLLSKWQADIKNMESAVIRFLIDESSIGISLKEEEYNRAIFVQIKYVDSNNPPIFYIDNNLVKIDSLESILIYQLNTNEKYNKSIARRHIIPICMHIHPIDWNNSMTQSILIS